MKTYLLENNRLKKEKKYMLWMNYEQAHEQDLGNQQSVGSARIDEVSCENLYQATSPHKPSTRCVTPREQQMEWLLCIARLQVLHKPSTKQTPWCHQILAWWINRYPCSSRWEWISESKVDIFIIRVIMNNIIKIVHKRPS